MKTLPADVDRPAYTVEEPPETYLALLGAARRRCLAFVREGGQVSAPGRAHRCCGVDTEADHFAVGWLAAAASLTCQAS